MSGVWIAIVSAIVGALALTLFGVIGYAWRKLDTLAKEVSALPHIAQEKAEKMDAELRQELNSMRISQEAHVQNVNSMHLQLTQQMARFPGRDEVQSFVDRGVDRILQAVRNRERFEPHAD